MILVDTNVLLRIILEDNPTLARRAIADLERQPQGGVHVTDVTAAECVFVATGPSYRLSRQTIAEQLSRLLGQPLFANVNHLIIACHYFMNSRLDFADCILVGYARLTDVTVLTYDKQLTAVLEQPGA